MQELQAKELSPAKKESTINTTTIRNLPFKLYVEDQKQERFKKTLELLKDLEGYEPHSLKQLYNYKLTGIMEEEQEARNVSYEYRIGMMDPSRDAAVR